MKLMFMNINFVKFPKFWNNYQHYRLQSGVRDIYK